MVEARWPFRKCLWNSARNQSAGGGRINCAVTGRKAGETSATAIGRVAVAKTGAEATGAVLSPAWAVAQIVQVWWEVAELSECEWVACTVPITHTRAMESTHTALSHPPRLAETLIMSCPLGRAAIG